MRYKHKDATLFLALLFLVIANVALFFFKHHVVRSDTSDALTGLCFGISFGFFIVHFWNSRRARPSRS